MMEERLIDTECAAGGKATLKALLQPMTLADALAYREQHRWRKIRPASLQAVDALGDEVERLRRECGRPRGAVPEPPDDYPGKDDAA